MVSKKGQGLSLNVIIIAALALIVLVVLVMVFTGQIGKFQVGLSKEGKAELIKMRVQYGQCHPAAAAEANFDSVFSRAESADDQEQAKTVFLQEVQACNGFTDRVACEGSEGCSWS